MPKLTPAARRLSTTFFAVLLILISYGAIVGCGLIDWATGGTTESDTKKAKATALAVDAEATIVANSKLIDQDPTDVDPLIRRGNARVFGWTNSS